MKVQFRFLTDTKNMYRYEEIDEQGNPLTVKDGGKCGSLYVAKTALPGGPHQRLQITIEVPE